MNDVNNKQKKVQFVLSSNQLVDTDDLLIAATAMKNNSKIATLNADHFKRIDGLIVITPNDLY